MFALRCTGGAQRGRNAFVEAVECGSEVLDDGNHAQSDRGRDQSIFDQILAFCFFPKTN